MDFQYDLSPFIAFRDRAECERVRAIRKAEITEHPNPDFKISVIEDGRFRGMSTARDCLIHAFSP